MEIYKKELNNNRSKSINKNINNIKPYQYN